MNISLGEDICHAESGDVIQGELEAYRAWHGFIAILDLVRNEKGKDVSLLGLDDGEQEQMWDAGRTNC